MRQVATLRRQGGALVGRVRPMALAPGHPLARARGAGNSAVLFTAGGRTRLHGTGAGRWPTAEAVIGDLFEVYGADAARLPESVRARFEEDGRERGEGE